MLPYNNDLLYCNVTISHNCYHITMICYIVRLPYHRTMIYGNF